MHGRRLNNNFLKQNNMDYKYIEQLLERYWQCETTLEEEGILRTFFGQKDIPAELRPYQALFAPQQDEVLGDDFDEKMLAMVEEPVSVKAKSIQLTQRLMPLFRAAAIVAIILTLGNAAQAPWDKSWQDPRQPLADTEQIVDSTVVVPVQAEYLGDSIKTVAPAVKKY